MRNILITVMMLLVVVILFVGIISDGSNGIRHEIEEQGQKAITQISGLNP